MWPISQHEISKCVELEHTASTAAPYAGPVVFPRDRGGCPLELMATPDTSPRYELAGSFQKNPLPIGTGCRPPVARARSAAMRPRPNRATSPRFIQPPDSGEIRRPSMYPRGPVCRTARKSSESEHRDIMATVTGFHEVRHDLADDAAEFETVPEARSRCTR